MKQSASGTIVTLITVLNVGCVPTDVTKDDAKGRPYGEQERDTHRLRNQVNCAGWATALLRKTARDNSSFIIHCRMPKTVLFLRHNFCVVCISNRSNELFRLLLGTTNIPVLNIIFSISPWLQRVGHWYFIRLKPNGHYMCQLLQHYESLHFSTHCSCGFRMTFTINSVIFPNSINRSVIIMDMDCVLCDI